MSPKLSETEAIKALRQLSARWPSTLVLRITSNSAGYLTVVSVASDDDDPISHSMGESVLGGLRCFQVG